MISLSSWLHRLRYSATLSFNGHCLHGGERTETKMGKKKKKGGDKESAKEAIDRVDDNVEVFEKGLKKKERLEREKMEDEFFLREWAPVVFNGPLFPMMKGK